MSRPRCEGTIDRTVRVQPKDDPAVVATVHTIARVAISQIVSNGLRHMAYHDKSRSMNYQYLSSPNASCDSAANSEGLVPYSLAVRRLPVPWIALTSRSTAAGAPPNNFGVS